MKKLISLLLTMALLLFCAASLAETDLTACSIANGTVTAARWEDLTAPCSGTLLPFDLAAGDRVEAEAPLFRMMTTTVTAQESGTVCALFLQAGEKAEDAVSRYGCVLAITPDRLQRLQCTYSSAYNDDDCKQVHLGETLYFRSAKTDKTKGEGTVISVSGDSYVVEITQGEFDLSESLGLFRDDEYTASKKVGTGIVYNRDDLLIAASGVVASLEVQVGDRVSAGQTLMTLLGQDADLNASDQVCASSAGIVMSVPVSSGQQVWKGEVLARICPSDALEITADVDEVDLKGLQVGDKVSVTLDTAENDILTGTVTEISAQGVTRQNAAYFTVHVSLSEDGLMLGQSASVYLPKEE